MAEGDNAGGEAQAATGSAGIAWDGVRLPGLDATRVALVTGAAGAIGGSVVHALAALGVRVGVLGRSETAVRHAVADCRRAEPDQLLPLVGDVSVQADMARCVYAVTERWGRLDVLVHAAAIGDPKSTLRDVTPEGIDHMLAVNVKGTLLIAQA
ncbi:MAG: SDR family NAD(P)-dependent oxidoreductase, partial [Micromonosporaceae bacterium]